MGIISFLIYLMIMIGIYAILSLSLNWQYGYAGLANFGQVAFFCIGAYAYVIVAKCAGAPFIIGILGAMVASGLFALLISLPIAEFGEDALAIVTLAAAEIVRQFFLNEGWVTGGGPYEGGAYGVVAIPRPLESLFSTFSYQFFYLFIVLIFLAVVFFILNYLARSPFGRALKAIREDLMLPKVMGKNTSSFRIQALIVGGAVGGLGGGLFAPFLTFIDPYYFTANETFILWAMVIIGGKGNPWGPIAGTAFIQLFYMSTRFLKDYVPVNPQVLSSLRMVIIGILILLVILFMEEGILKEKKKIYKR